MLVQRDDDRFDDLVMAASATADVNMRFGVGRAAFIGQPLERALGIGVAKQGPGVAA